MNLEREKAKCLFNSVFDLQAAGYSNDEISLIFQQVVWPDVAASSMDISLMTLGYSSGQADFIKDVISSNFGNIDPLEVLDEELAEIVNEEDCIIIGIRDGSVETSSPTFSEEETRSWLISIGDFLKNNEFKKEEPCDSQKGTIEKPQRPSLKNSVTGLMKCLMNCTLLGLRLLIDKSRHSRI